MIRWRRSALAVMDQSCTISRSSLDCSASAPSSSCASSHSVFRRLGQEGLKRDLTDCPCRRSGVAKHRAIELDLLAADFPLFDQFVSVLEEIQHEPPALSVVHGTRHDQKGRGIPQETASERNQGTRGWPVNLTCAQATQLRSRDSRAPCHLS